MKITHLIYDETNHRAQLHIGAGPGIFSTPYVQVTVLVPKIEGEADDARRQRAVEAARSLMQEAAASI